MSFGLFKFYYYFVFVWGGIGVATISVAVIREIILQFRKVKEHSP